MKSMRFVRYSALSVLPVVLAAACSSQSNDEPTLEKASSAVVQPVLSCDARGTAVTAVTGNVTLNGGVIDSYQSSVGAYGGTNVSANGNVVAKGNIVIQNHGAINGTQTAHASPNMPLPAVPTNATKLPLGSSQPGSVNINGVADSITLAPGVYVVRDLSINSPGALRISGNAPVTIFVTNSLNLGGSVNPNGIPANLTLIMTKTGAVALNSGGRLFGNIYAPTSSVTLNSPVFGYVVGSSVTLNTGSSLHYDMVDACVNLPNPNTSTKTNPTYGSLTFTVRLPSGEQVVEIFVRRNGVLVADKDITSSEAPNGDGTSIYSYTQSGVADGDQIDYRFRSKLPGGTDTFSPGPSQGWSTVCEAFDQCHAGTFDAVNNVCTKPAKPNGVACNDGNACTKTDTCQAGVCQGSNPVVCTASDQCHAVGTCDPAGGCSNPSVPDGTACNDKSGCTTSDVCTAGICAGTVDTNPANPACLGQNQGFGNPTSQPHQLPFPPSATGCYAGTRDGTWFQLPCDPTGLQNHRMEVSNDGVEVPPASRANISYVFGQAETTIIHTDSQLNNDSGVTENDSWSMQVNTNTFAASATDTGFVQFIFGKWPNTLHPDQPAGSRICAYPVTWKTGMDPATTGDYNTHIRCISGAAVSGLPAISAGKLADFDYVNLAGFAYDDNSSPPQHLIATVVQYSMVPDPTATDPLAQNQIPGLYAVVAPDIGLAGHWFVTTGGIMGKADSSAANFTNGELLTTISASNCPGDTSATGVTCPSLPALSDAGASTAYRCVGTCTAESDNLSEIQAPGAAFPNRNLIVSQVLASDHTSGGSPACLAGLSDDVFVKDNDADEGGIPSNSGGVPFWESPDIFILPASTPPAPPQLNDVAADFQVTLGQDYDVYLRVNNDFGCNPVSNLQVIIDGADPSIGFANWSPITTGADTNQFVAAPGNPTVPAFGKAVVGPFRWTPSTDLAGGHKCLRAAVVGGNQAFPFPEGVAGDWPEAFASHQIAQRNIQVTNGSNCDYSINNPSPNAVNALFGINITPASSLAGSTINLTFDDDASFDRFAIWSAQAARLPAGTMTVAKGTSAQPTTILTLNTSSIALDTVSIAAGTSPNVHIDITTTASPVPKVAISSRLEDPEFHTILLENGGSCQPTQQGIVTCDPGLSFCGETCVDLNTDNSNCGSCGNACTGGAECFAGSCVVIG